MSLFNAILAAAMMSQSQAVGFTPAERVILKKIEQVGGSSSVIEEDERTLLCLDIDNKDQTLDFTALAGLERLNVLRILQGSITERSLSHLTKFKKLELLVIVCSGLTDKGLKEIGKITSLKKLDFGGDKITKNGLAELKNLKNIDRLFLYNTTIKDADLEPLGHLLSLTELCLPMTVSEEGVRLLKARLPKASIRRL